MMIPFLVQRTRLKYATHIADKTSVDDEINDNNRKFMVADTCLIVSQKLAPR